MSISFNTIPIDIRTPGAYVEFDASRAVRGLPAIPHKILVIGQKLVAGLAVAATPIRIQTADQAITQFGRGSMLAQMFKRLKLVDSLTETWALPLSDNGAGVAATKTVTLTGPATAAGTLALLVAGARVPVAVAAADTATVVATAAAAAVNAQADLPVTAASAAGVVTLTARHKGECGNDIDVRVNYYAGEATPSGLAVAIAAGVNGTTNPDTAAVFTAIGDDPYTAFISAYTDAANLTVIETALASRWGPMRMLDGVAYCAAKGTFGALSALGAARNSAFCSIVGFKSSPTPPWEWAAAYGGVVGYHGAIDPARPFQTLALAGILPPVITDRWTRDERELLLRDGISTTVQDSGGVVLIERAISTYQTNPAGFDDVAFLDINTALTLAYLRYSLRARIASKYPRHKLGNDGGIYGAGQAIVTPSVIRAEVIAWFMDLMSAGLVENLEQFKADLVVQRDGTDNNRVNAIIPPNLVNQFRVFAAQIQFLL